MADRLRSWLRRRQPIERSALPVPSSGGKTYNAFMSYSHAVDNKFAPTLQRALQRFAKPWFRRQALRVFRDEESLSANPGLWSSIQLALDSAEFFILLASPESARSRWVDREVAYWLAHKPEQKLLIAVTGGEVVWDDRAGDFDWEHTTALPPSLRGRFSEEPRYIDFSWARTEQHISLRHTLFRDRVADLAAPLHHRPKTTSSARRSGSTTELFVWCDRLLRCSPSWLSWPAGSPSGRTTPPTRNDGSATAPRLSSGSQLPAT